MYYKLMILISFFTMLLFGENLVINSGFEKGAENWNLWGAEIKDNGKNGKKCLYVKNNEHKWSGADQIITIPKNSRSVKVSGWMKSSKIVSGNESWEQALFSIEFVDSDGNQMGRYPDKTGITGNKTDWTFYESEHSVEYGASGIKVTTALGNAIGEVWYDDLTVEVTDNEGKILALEDLNKMIEEEKKRYNKAPNHIIDPGFEKSEDGWSLNSGEYSNDSHKGDKAYKLSSKNGEWSGVEQSILLPEKAHRIYVSAWMKTENVVLGKEDWCKASITLTFHDKNGKMLGDYPPETGNAIGTTGWTNYSMGYSVMTGSKKVNLQLALNMAKSGIALFDDIRITVEDREGNFLDPVIPSGPTDEGEWYQLGTKNSTSGSHYVDWSSLLDAPAGKHGFLKAVDGHLQFEDGTPIKFWGTTLCDENVFVEKDKADSLASRLAKMGCNILRLHHMDAPWGGRNIFGKAENTRKLNPEMLDRLDYLIYALKQKGIYTFLDILVHREFMKSDGVPKALPDYGAKQVGFFSRKVIDLQKEYAEQLLTHKNKYTGLEYRNEPAIAVSEFINESTIYSHFGGDMVLKSPYRKELESLWNKKFPGKKLGSFDQDWESGLRPVMKNTIEGADVKESVSFLMGLEDSYYDEMNKHFRDLGVKYILCGSNMPYPILSMLKSYSKLDMVIQNEYWDHPQLWKIKGDWNKVRWAPFHNGSQLQSLETNLIEKKAYYKVHNKPYLLTEWNHCYPNEYQLEGAPLMAAYASLQGWDGALQFDVDHASLGKGYIDNFNVNRSGEDLAQWVAAAPMFLRGDIKEAPGEVIESVSDEMVISEKSFSPFLDNNYYLPFVTKVSKSFKGEKGGVVGKYKRFFDRYNSIVRSETGELTLDGNVGVLEINSDKVQGVCGFIGGRKYSLPKLDVDVKNSHSSVIAVSKDGKPLFESKEYYLVVTGPTKLSNQRMNRSRTVLKKLGDLPLLAQVINGTVTLKSTSKIVVTPLNPDGSDMDKMSVTNNGNAYSIDLSKGRSFVYRVSVK